MVQDYALVISCGEGEVTNAFTVTDRTRPIVSNPTADQQITYVIDDEHAVAESIGRREHAVAGHQSVLTTVTRN